MTPIVYEFLGYLADQAGLLSLIYQEIVDRVNVDIDSQWRDYDRRKKQMQIEKDFSKPLRMPPPRIQPEKKYGEMFQKWLKLEEKDVYCDLDMVL